MHVKQMNDSTWLWFVIAQNPMDDNLSILIVVIVRIHLEYWVVGPKNIYLNDPSILHTDKPTLLDSQRLRTIN